jgi:hypothetical protein
MHNREDGDVKLVQEMVSGATAKQYGFNDAAVLTDAFRRLNGLCIETGATELESSNRTSEKRLEAAVEPQTVESGDGMSSSCSEEFESSIQSSSYCESMMTSAKQDLLTANG